MMRLTKKQACDLVRHNSDGYLDTSCIQALRSWGMREKDAHLFVAVLAKLDRQRTDTAFNEVKRAILSLQQKGTEQ